MSDMKQLYLNHAKDEMIYLAFRESAGMVLDETEKDEAPKEERLMDGKKKKASKEEIERIAEHFAGELKRAARHDYAMGFGTSIYDSVQKREGGPGSGPVAGLAALAVGGLLAADAYRQHKDKQKREKENKSLPGDPDEMTSEEAGVMTNKRNDAYALALRKNVRDANYLKLAKEEKEKKEKNHSFLDFHKKNNKNAPSVKESYEFARACYELLKESIYDGLRESISLDHPTNMDVIALQNILNVIDGIGRGVAVPTGLHTMQYVDMIRAAKDRMLSFNDPNLNEAAEMFLDGRYVDAKSKVKGALDTAKRNLISNVETEAAKNFQPVTKVADKAQKMIGYRAKEKENRKVRKKIDNILLGRASPLGLNSVSKEKSNKKSKT
jgi:hypothetical protein